MRKLTFERAVLIVLILIMLISTSSITIGYIERYIKRYDRPYTSNVPSISIGFPTMLTAADNFYKVGDFESASREYFALTLNTPLSTQQKAHVYFRLGISQYNLEKYDLAANSFAKAASFSSDDSVAYNNAAVSAYKNKDINKAIEYQIKALNILSGVEFYYNLARMYEDNGEYELAVTNFLVVAKGEQNITKTDVIDPVRIKEKLARLQLNNKEVISSSGNGVIIAFKIEDPRDILTLNENEMQLKQGDFTVKVENRKASKNIIAEYDRKKYDPYNLISELLWTVYKDGKAIYKKSSDKVSINADSSGTYDIKLNMRYNGKEKVSNKIVNIKDNSSTWGDSSQNEVTIEAPRKGTRTYEYAIYEQLFESDFAISKKGYTDNYNVVWGKDDVTTSFNKKLMRDKESSLLVENTSKKDGGLWVNLDNLLKTQDIKGRFVTISFWIRKISSNADLDMTIRTKSNNTISASSQSFALDYKWGQKSYSLFIPEEASGLTLSIKTKPGEYFNIDGFIIVN